MRRRITTCLILILPVFTASAASLQQYLRTNGMPPADYVVSKIDRHRIVILGEEVIDVVALSPPRFEIP